MSNVIDADAAKLAGLQIDLLQKIRSGSMTLSHLEWFVGLGKDARDVFMTGGKFAAKRDTPAESEKFALLVDLGIITVPDAYDHSTQLALFANKYKKSFYYYNTDITDAHFPNPSRILKSGEKLRVKIFKQIVSGSTTSEERIAFLKSQNAVFVGAQGASFVYEQKRDQLPKGYWHTSLDERDRLWQDADGDHGVPRVYASSGGGFAFDLAYFEVVWLDDDTLLCFCDE